MTKAEQRIQNVVDPRAIKNFRKILADKNVKSVEQKDGWTYIRMTNGQIFGCRGPVVDAALTGDAPAEKPAKDYTKPKRGTAIRTITVVDRCGTPTKRKRVFIEAEFEHFGEKFFVFKKAAGSRVVTHQRTGGALSQPTTGKLDDVVKSAREKLDNCGAERFAQIISRPEYTPAALEALPFDETIGG